MYYLLRIRREETEEIHVMYNCDSLIIKIYKNNRSHACLKKQSIESFLSLHHISQESSAIPVAIRYRYDVAARVIIH